MNFCHRQAILLRCEKYLRQAIFFFLKQTSTNNGRVHLCLWTQTIFRFLIWMFLLVYVSLYLFIFIYMLLRLCLFNILTNINKWTRKRKFVVYLFIFIWLNLNQQIWKNTCFIVRSICLHPYTWSILVSVRNLIFSLKGLYHT